MSPPLVSACEASASTGREQRPLVPEAALLARRGGGNGGGGGGEVVVGEGEDEGDGNIVTSNTTAAVAAAADYDDDARGQHQHEEPRAVPPDAAQDLAQDPAGDRNDASAPRALKEIAAPVAKLKRSLAGDDDASATPSQPPQPQAAASPGMIFSDFYKGPRSPLAKLRHHHPQAPTTPEPPTPAQLPTATPDWAGAEYADLLSRDKAKQKEAVKRYLADKVHADWEFPWPPQPRAPAAEASTQDEEIRTSTADHQGGAGSPAKQVQDETHDDEGYQVDEGSELEEPPSDDGQVDGQDDDAQSIYSIVSEDALHYRPRAEWASDLSDDDTSATLSPFRSDASSSGPRTAKAAAVERQARRRRALRDEMVYNEGLACFEARRDAWTGARTVRVRSKPVSPSPASPRSPRRFFFRRSTSDSPPNSLPVATAHGTDASGTVSDASSGARDTHDRDLQKEQTQGSAISDPAPPQTYPVETLVPIGQPLLPPNNPLRASITPAVYYSLYDKVILNNLQPACPVNLSDMLRACVAGWKRDGEWPPRSTPMDPVMAMRRKKKAAAAGNENSGNVARRMSFGLLGRDGGDESRAGKGIRRSLQRALGFGVVPGHPDGDAAEGEKPRDV